MQPCELIIAGGSGGSNIGDSFMRSASACGRSAVFINTALAFGGSNLIRKFNWHIRGHRPSRIDSFSSVVQETCIRERPKYLLTTGLSPINRKALESIGKVGVVRMNYLTDDPWNKCFYSRWFMEALPFYDLIFSPRKANISDLLKKGCKDVRYLPFAYDPDLFYPESITDNFLEFDIIFAGAAEQSRVPYITALIQAGLKVGLYGSFWERYRETRHHTRGQIEVSILRHAVSCSKIALCLVRRSNRDGHCMRSFEIPAMRACMLTEDTIEHQELLGPEGKAAVYFKDPDEMVKKARHLINNPSERKRLGEAAYQLITRGNHTYLDRLRTILDRTNGLK